MSDPMFARKPDGRRPNLLILTSERPCGPTYGAQLRLMGIARLLRRIGHVAFVVVGQPDVTAQVCEFEIQRLVPVVRAPGRNFARRVYGLLDPSSVETEGYCVPEAERTALLESMKDYDMVWIHGLRTANMFRVFRWPRSVLDIDDIPSRFFASQARDDDGLVRKIRNYRKSVVWRWRERKLQNRFDVVAVVSEEDRDYFGGQLQPVVVPNGFDAPAEPPRRTPAEPPRIGFIGNLNYLPNKNGVERFIKCIWPRVKRQIPEARLRLVGEGSESHFGRIGPDIDGLGWVADAGKEIATWTAMVVPVFVGAGSRIKIADAFSKKCPVVSTSLGAFGYQVVPNEDLLIADDDSGFALACVMLAREKELGIRLSETAWNKFINHWTWEASAAAVNTAASACLAKSRNERRSEVS